jgi:hypothetical protein
MCNEVARRISLDLMRSDFDQRKIRLMFPESAPNMEPLGSIRITDSTVIVRKSENTAGAHDDRLDAELVTRRWSWPGAHGKPIYNFLIGTPRLGVGAVPDSPRQFFRIYQGGGPKGEAEGQMGLHPRARGLVRPLPAGTLNITQTR